MARFRQVTRTVEYTNADIMAVNIDMDQSAISFTPVVGFDYKVGDFNFAAKYEFRAINHLENDTKQMEIKASDAMNQFGMGQTIEGAASGQYVQFRMIRGGWMFVSEVEVYGAAE